MCVHINEATGEKKVRRIMLNDMTLYKINNIAIEH